MLEQVILLSAALVGMGEGKVELPLSVAMQRIDSGFAEHLRQEGFTTTPEPCTPIISEGLIKGFEIQTGSDVWAFDLDGYLLSESEETNYYSSGDPGITELATLSAMNGFNPTSCLCQIPSLVSQYGSAAFGNWSVLSFDSGSDDCAQIASMDLIYTYRFSGMGNPTTYGSSSVLYNALKTEQNYQPGLGILLSDYLPGLNAVLSSSFHATSGSYNATKPVVCAYAPDSGSLGHFAMKIGEAETTVFWNLKQQWDLIVSREGNYIGAEPVSIDHNQENCFFGIQSNRRQATFLLFGC